MEVLGRESRWAQRSAVQDSERHGREAGQGRDAATKEAKGNRKCWTQRTNSYKQRSRNVKMRCRVWMICKERVPVVVVRSSHYCNADVSRCVGDGGCSGRG